MQRVIRAFVSSTYEDLKEHRAHVIATLRRLEVVVNPMEDWTAEADEPKKFCKEHIDGCDLCVLLVAYRRGFIPVGETNSITQLEYKHAVQNGIPVLVFLLEEDTPWRPTFNDLDRDPEIKVWRDELSKQHGREEFGADPRSLDVGPAVMRLLKRIHDSETAEDIVVPEKSATQLCLETFQSTATQACDDYIDKMQREGVYLSNLYARRVELEGWLVSFLDAKCNRTGMLIVGSSGVGKTTTLCHIVTEWRRSSDLLGSDIVLLLGAGTLLGGSFNLKDTLLDQLQVTSGFNTLQSQLQAIYEATGTRLILIIDGVDKHPQPRELLRQIDQLIIQCEAVPWLKVIASIGEVVYNTIRNVHSSPLTIRAYYTISTREGPVETEHAEVPLGRLTESELRDAYDRYRQVPGLAPTSSFEELTDDVKSAITDPLFLRIVMEVFNGKHVPRRVLTAKVLQQYCEKKVFSDPIRTEFVKDFVRHLYEHKETSAKTDDLRQVETLRKHVIDEQSALSPYVQLLEEKVLERQAKKLSSLVPMQIWVGFTYDRLLEYLLTCYVLDDSTSSSTSTPNLQDIITKLSVDALEYPPLQGVIVTLLLDRIEDADFAGAASLLQVGACEVMQRVALDLLTELELMDPSSVCAGESPIQTSQAACLIEAMMDDPALWLRTALLELGMRFQRLGRLPSAKLVYEHGLSFCQSIDDREGAVAMLDALGCVQFGLGELVNALDTLEAAITHFHELSTTGDTAQYAQAKARCLINLSEVYHRQGNIPGAKELLDECRHTLDQIDDPEGLAVVLQKQAVLMRRNGCSRDARECHLKALQINEALGDDRGRATNLCGIGLTYLVDGDWEPAFTELRKALSEYEKIGDKAGTAYTCNALGETYRWHGDYLDQAMVAYTRALKLYEEMGAERDIHMVENNLGATCLFAGDAIEAMKHLRRAQELQIKEGHEPGEPETLAFISGAALDLGDMETAIVISDAAATLLMEDMRRFGEEDIQLVFWYRYLILQALNRHHDAQEALKIAYDNVMAQVATLCDIEACNAFVQNFRLRCQIVEAYKNSA